MGAGDQGMMFGYACKESPEFMPLPITIAHRLAEKIDSVRISKKIPYLRPDGKTQVTIQYENGVAKTVETLVLAVPHSEKVDLATVRMDLMKHVVTPVLANYKMKIDEKRVIVNGTGIWHIGGPASDTGVTGRKIVVVIPMEEWRGWEAGHFLGRIPQRSTDLGPTLHDISQKI